MTKYNLKKRSRKWSDTVDKICDAAQIDRQTLFKNAKLLKESLPPAILHNKKVNL